MITKTKKIDLNHIDTYAVHFLPKDSCFFDIETTGLASSKNHIYMIGCGVLHDTSFEITQFFSESNDSEVKILNAFITFCKNYSTFISFNGIGFDLPFLRARMELHHIDFSFDEKKQIDIYKECKNLKNLLSLPSLKQKSIEEFLGIFREDKFSGKELISHYRAYKKNPNKDVEDMLFLHNFEDVLGMIDILPILTYRELFADDFTIKEAAYHASKHCSCEHTIDITLEYPYAIPTPIHKVTSNLFLSVKENLVHLSISLYDGICNYYLSDYKNYDYLIDEKMIIYKSLSSSIDKSRKTPVTKENCFLPKEGLFFPVAKKYNNEKIFQKNYQSKSYFIAFSDSLFQNDLFHTYIYDNIKSLATS